MDTEKYTGKLGILSEAILWHLGSKHSSSGIDFFLLFLKLTITMNFLPFENIKRQFKNITVFMKKNSKNRHFINKIEAPISIYQILIRNDDGIQYSTTPLHFG